MAQLLIRAGTPDAALIESVMSDVRAVRPDRLVVDAHVAAHTPELARSAGRAGRGFLVDPQTYLWQGAVHPLRSWARLPFAQVRPMLATEVSDLRVARVLVERAIEFQLGHGATHIIAPYVHVEGAGDGWVQAQLTLWHATRDYLDAHGLHLPVVAVLSLGWRLHARRNWPAALSPLLGALGALEPDEVALASSKMDRGADPAARLVDMLRVVQRLANHFPVIVWRQGALGEAAILAGASGVETGIGWRDRCDLQTAKNELRGQPTPGGTPHPTYIGALHRSMTRAQLAAVSRRPDLAAQITCLDAACCPNGARDLTRDGRRHSIAARAANINRMASAAHESWRWEQLAVDTGRALVVTASLNDYLDRLGDPKLGRLDSGAITAMHTVALQRRRSTRRGRPAA
ncbi:MAG: hypothetical protein IE923_00220 [Micrococcales bacterium]|nr:hypothetical protein [Micrococcales bacterium]